MHSTTMMIGGSSLNPSLVLIYTGLAFILAGIAITVTILLQKQSRYKSWSGLLPFFGLGAGMIVVGLLLGITIT